MKTTVRAITLVSSDRKERDKLVDILCDDDRVIRAYAPRARLPKSPLCAATEPFTRSEMELHSTASGFCLDSARNTQINIGIRRDIIKCSLADYIAKLADSLLLNDRAPGMFSAFSNFLHLLANSKRSAAQLKATMELYIAAKTGWCPSAAECADCGKEPSAFSIPDGSAFCGECSKRHPGSVEAGSAVLKAMSRSIGGGKEMFLFTIEGGGLEAFSKIAEEYVKYHLDRLPDSLEYYKEMLSMEDLK